MAGINSNPDDGNGTEEVDGTAFDLMAGDNEPQDELHEETGDGDGSNAGDVGEDEEVQYVDEAGNVIDPNDLDDDTEIIEDGDPDTDDDGAGKKEDVDPRDATIAQQAEQIKQLMEMVQNGTSQQQPQAQQDAQPTDDTTPKATEPLASEEELSKIIDEGDVGALNTVLQRVQTQTAQALVGNLPRILDGMVNQQVTQKQVIDNFYQENDDLVAHKQHVALVGQELAKANPQWDMPTLLKETAAEFRKRFNMSKSVKPKDGDDDTDDQKKVVKKKVVRIASKKGQPQGAGGKQGGPKKAPKEKDPSELTDEEVQNKEMDSLFVGLQK